MGQPAPKSIAAFSPPRDGAAARADLDKFAGYEGAQGRGPRPQAPIAA